MHELAGLMAFVIPASLGAAWSPIILVTATDLADSTKASRSRGLAFWLGGVIALVVWAVILASALWAWLQSAARDLEKDLPMMEIALGVILVLVGFVTLLQWRHMVTTIEQARAHHHHDSGGQHRTLAGVVAFGAVMQGRDVSSMVLYVAIVGRIGSADVPLPVKFAVLAVSIGIITTAFWLPLAAPATLPHHLAAWISPLGRWLDRHGRTVTVAVIWTMAALLLYHGIVLGG
ncbi:MAG: GAP family protein [Actinobacteria bacterium]|nr:GAP family protein [Actinomycetota bacterium]